MHDLTLSDYKDILYYYNVDFEKFSTNKIINDAEDIMGGKLCRCIKKVNMGKGVPIGMKAKQKTRRKGRAIGICRNAVIRRKGYRIKKFSCKKRTRIEGLRK